MHAVPPPFIHPGTEVLLELGSGFFPKVPPKGLGHLGNWNEASDIENNGIQLSWLCVHMAQKEAIKLVMMSGWVGRYTWQGFPIGTVLVPNSCWDAVCCWQAILWTLTARFRSRLFHCVGLDIAT